MNKCIDCTERHIGCHSTCKDYAELKKESDKRLYARMAFYKENNPAWLYKLDGIAKRARKEMARAR